MDEVLKDLNSGKYVRTQVIQDKLERPRSKMLDMNSIEKGQLIE